MGKSTATVVLPEDVKLAITEAVASSMAKAMPTIVAAVLDGLTTVGQAPEPSAPARRSTPKATGSTTQRRSRQVEDISEPEKGRNIEMTFILEPGYFVAPGDQVLWLRKAGMDISLTGELPTMADVVGFIRDLNGRNRGEGSTVTYWAKFRISGSRTRLTSHQVRHILRNGNLRGYKAPAKR